MKQTKYLFIDRDGTLIAEPADEQVDSLEKLLFLPGVFTALNQLQSAGYCLVIVSNQDGLGTDSFTQDNFEQPQAMMLKIFQSQGITFEDVLICPHFESDNCLCRKPKLGLLMDYLVEQTIDKKNSYVIGDRESDMKLAKNLGIPGLKIGPVPIESAQISNWESIARLIIEKPRVAALQRKTTETDIRIALDLDREGEISIKSGLGFFDHMLEQIIKHAGISASISIDGDLDIDDHHTIEDTALSLGTAIREALGDKTGIERFGFLLPMDEAQAVIALDLSGRSFCRFDCDFKREKVGGLSTEMIAHFFKSFAGGLQATLQIEITGSNAHHMCEAAFKGVGRTLRQAIARNNASIPSTKGVL